MPRDPKMEFVQTLAEDMTGRLEVLFDATAEKAEVGDGDGREIPVGGGTIDDSGISFSRIGEDSSLGKREHSVNIDLCKVESDGNSRETKIAVFIEGDDTEWVGISKFKGGLKLILSGISSVLVSKSSRARVVSKSASSKVDGITKDNIGREQETVSKQIWGLWGGLSREENKSGPFRLTESEEFEFESYGELL